MDEGDDFERLTELALFEQAAAAGTLPALIERLARAAAAAPAAGDDRGQILALLARALRIDLAFLVDHPEEVLSCLHNRCCLPDSPAGRVVARWAEQRTARGRPWARSLRPPELAPGGPLLEEYRGAFGYPCGLWLDDGAGGGSVTVSHNGGPARVSTRRSPDGGREERVLERVVERWDRATGRRLPARTVLDVLPGTDVDVSPDGRLRVEREDHGRLVKLIDGASGATLASYPMGDARVSYAAFFPDGSHVALAGWADEDDDYGGRITIVDVGSRLLVARIGTPGTPFHPTVSRDGRRIAVHVHHRVLVWEWQTGQIVADIATDAQEIAFGPDGRTLVTAAEGVVRVWDLGRGDRGPELPGSRDYIADAIFSPNGERLVTGQWICDARSGARIADLDHATGHYLEGGPTLPPLRVLDRRIVCLERGITVWDAETGRRLFALDGSERFFAHWHLVAVSADGARYAVTRRARWTEGRPKQAELEVFDLDSGRKLAAFSITEASSIAFSPDGARLIVGSGEGVARIWDAGDGRLSAVFAGHPSGRDVRGVAFLGDGRYAASGADDDAVCVWDSRTGALHRRRDLGEGDGQYSSFGSGARDPGEHRYWHVTPGAVAEVEAWVGLRPPRRFTAERAAGAIRIVDRVTGEAIAWLAAGERLEPHPDAPIWAGGPLHFKLEGEPGR